MHTPHGQLPQVIKGVMKHWGADGSRAVAPGRWATPAATGQPCQPTAIFVQLHECVVHHADGARDFRYPRTAKARPG